MQLVIQTWDGNNLQDGTNYQAVIPPGNAMPTASPNFIDLGQSNPVLAGKTLGGGLFTFQVVCIGTPGGASFEARRDQLGKWFRPDDFTLRKLVAYDINDSNRAWYLQGFPVTGPTLMDGSQAGFTIQLALSVPYWRENVANTDTWEISSSGETNVYAARGNVPSLPTFEITATDAKAGGYTYKIYKALYSVRDSFRNHPVDLTDGGWDTETLVDDSKMQADGDDLRVIVNGVEVDRWLVDIDTAATKVWVNLTIPPSPPLLLSGNIAGAGAIASIVVTDNSDGRSSLTIPPNGTLLIDDECFTYSAYNASTKTFTVTEREAKTTSAAAHTSGAAAYLIYQDIWIQYGNSTATAPIVDDTKKPAIDLDASTNTQFVYADLFGSSDGLRTAGWQPNLITPSGENTLSRYYTDTHGDNVSPFEVVGGKLSSYTRNGVIISDEATITWRVSCPGGVTDIDFDGDSYRSGANWPASAKLTYIPVNAAYDLIAPEVDIYAIPSPSTAAAWETFTDTVALGSDAAVIILRFQGGLGTASPLAEAYAELNQVTLDFNALYTIQISTGTSAETANYSLDATISNGATGDALILKVPSSVGNKITIDCTNQLIYSEDGKRIRGMLSFNSKRDEWMTFLAGNNTLTYTDTGTAGVDIVATWEGRNTL